MTPKPTSYARSRVLTTLPITRADLERLGCQVVRRNHKLWINTEAGVKDTAGKWIGRINEAGVFEPNYTALSGYKMKLRAKAVSV